MEKSTLSESQWRSSTSLIFWGILALTVFGCVSSFCEFFFGPLDTAKGYIDDLLNAAIKLDDQSNAEGFCKFYNIHSTLAIWTRAAEILTIGGWIAYVIGLSKFRDAQISDKGRWLAGSLYSACWLGLIGMGCTFIGSFLGTFGILFRFTGWLLNIISLFKFRSAFNRLSIEESWVNLARHGARNLKSSYTFGIILAFYPLIIFFSAIFLVLGSIGSFHDIASSFANDGFNVLYSVIGGSIAIVILFALAAVVLWICQVCLLISGWYRIKNGAPEGDAEEEQPQDNSAVVIACSIVGTIILIGLAVWTCISPLTARDTTYHIGPLPKEDSTYNETMQSNDEESHLRQEEQETSYGSADEEPSSTTEEFSGHDQTSGDTYTRSYKGTINDKYGIEMTLTTDGGSYYTGEYFYTKNKQPIQLRGQLTDDDDHLVMEEYVGMNMTGRFEGTLYPGGYRGTWTSTDGERSYPFSVTLK